MLLDAIENTPVIFPIGDDWDACEASEQADVDYWHYGIVVVDANGSVECEMTANVEYAR
jgi:hypothetical protein